MVTIEINGVDKTDSVNFKSFRLTENVNDQTDQVSFESTKYKPNLGEEIEVFYNSTKIYGGVIVRVSTEIDGLFRRYKVSCKDYTHYLDRKLVTERFTGQTVGYIIDFLLDKYATDFTDTNVIGDAVITNITFNRITVSQCIKLLADQLGYSWYVDFDKDIHFFPFSEEVAPFNLTDAGGNHDWNSLSITEDFSKIRNQVYVLGGEYEADEQTESYIADGEQKQFPLAFKFSTLPTVSVNSVALDVGVDGIDDEDEFDVFWNFQQKYIRFKDSTFPDATDTVDITGKPLLPVVVRVPNVVSIIQNGIYEYKIVDKNIKSREDAIERAIVEIQSYANAVSEGSFKTKTNGLRAGQTININVDGRNEDYIIQSVTMSFLDPFNAEWQVKIATAKTLGIIKFLQRLLLVNDDIQEGEQLLSLILFGDSVEMSDTLTFPVETSQPPYYYADATVNGNEGRWNFSTWS